MKESGERLSKALEKFRDSDPMDEDELANADFVVAYYKGRFWRAKRVTATPLELHASQYGIKSASMFLIDRGEVATIPINKIYKAWLPDGYSQIFRIACVWPCGLLDYGSATLRCKI